jgi:hypothetical protein
MNARHQALAYWLPSDIRPFATLTDRLLTRRQASIFFRSL